MAVYTVSIYIYIYSICKILLSCFLFSFYKLLFAKGIGLKSQISDVVGCSK